MGSSNIQGETTFGHIAQVALPIIGGVAGALFGGVGAPIGAAAGSALGNVIANETARGGGGGGMATNPFGGKGGGGSSGGNVTINPGSLTTNVGPLAQAETQLAQEVNAITPMELGQAQPLLGAGMGEFISGATGQLTPAQQATSDFELGQANLGTESAFANLGLGPGTTMTADLNANLLGNEALKNSLLQQSQTEGLNAMRTGLSFEQAGTGAAATAGNLLDAAAKVLVDQNATALNALRSATSGLGNLLGGGSSGGKKGHSNPAPSTTLDNFDPFAGNTIDSSLSGSTAPGPLFDLIPSGATSATTGNPLFDFAPLGAGALAGAGTGDVAGGLLADVPSLITDVIPGLL